MTRIFKLVGSVTTPDGLKVSGIRVAVVDDDPILDDLIGVGFTDSDGRFRLSFTHREFNQDLGENEALPDIRVVLSARFDGRFEAVHEQRFPDLAFEPDTIEDLGKIVVSSWSAGGPTPLEGVDPTPGWGKRVQRLDLDAPLVTHCLQEITPMVESLTGWRGLLDDLKVDVTDHIGPYVNHFLVALLGDGTERWATWLLDAMMQHMVRLMGLYDPFSHTLVIHKSNASNLNLDALKVVVGHELVHVGQFRNHPELLEQQKGHVEWLKNNGARISALEPKELQKILADSIHHQNMTELEGYAIYIQKDYLEKVYNMATFFTHTSMLDAVVQFLLRRFVPGTDETAALKNSQYTDGAEIFRKRQTRGDGPVSFAP